MADRSLRTRRVAGIDIGSNSVRLMVADATLQEDGSISIEVVDERTEVTRLSEGVDHRGILLPAPITRTRSALTSYRQAALAHGCTFVLATATSAVRDADNGEAFLGEVEYSFGFRTQLLSGSEEAELSWRGMRSDPGLDARVRTGSWGLVDIGGGSTEVLVARDGELVDSHSFQLGCVRLTERHLAETDPPAAAAIATTRAAVREQLQDRFPAPATLDGMVGVAGTVTTMAARTLGLATYDPDLVHRSEVSARAVHAELGAAAALPLEQRRELPGMEPRRAPVILAGYCILAEVLDHFGLAGLAASETDILNGIAWEAGRIAHAEDLRELPQPHGRTSC